ncbi:hypothetical protein EJB05_51286 [Eragrostis curvula]|uniref:Uncharacterized protein n=1 Tax=Eragrostis curvula TaxID=38414 RepID=A0A5J9SW79_9POAL|nr:hypothetical protein EJB05_51286 [Eragrostis curvula]
MQPDQTKRDDGETKDQSPPSPSVPMTFLVHVGGKICLNSKRCWDWRVGSMKFMDSRDVTWYELQENLKAHGYKWNTDLYFLIPGETPPEGMVIILGQEQVNLLMNMHKGKKKMKTCHLYIVKKPRPGSYDCGYTSSESDNDNGNTDDEYNPVEEDGE